MDWIPSLLKQLSVSRSAVVAVFITAVVLYGGPRVAPTYFDTVPTPWSVLVQASLVFSGCLVLFWAWSSAARKASKNVRKLVQLYRSQKLDENEAGLLIAMGQNPSDPLSVQQIDFRGGDFPLSELELLQVLNRLSSKGLISKNPFASHLYSLTERGRKVSLEVTQSSLADESDRG